jgi:hypothetical protein
MQLEHTGLWLNLPPKLATPLIATIVVVIDVFGSRTDSWPFVGRRFWVIIMPTIRPGVIYILVFKNRTGSRSSTMHPQVSTTSGNGQDRYIFTPTTLLRDIFGLTYSVTATLSPNPV